MAWRSSSEAIEERFWAKVNKLGPVSTFRPDLGNCWAWQGSCTPDGYARFTVNKVILRAHRYSYELATRTSFPEGLVADHLCRVRNCVRPSHIEPKTHVENILAEGSLAGVAIAAHQSSKTHCPQGHEYTEGSIKQYAGRRYRKCSTCQNTHAKNFYTRNRESILRKRRFKRAKAHN